jgi:hypothetical protein
MINLQKSLEAVGPSIDVTPVKLIGVATGNRVVVEWPTGGIWSFTKNEKGVYYSGQHIQLRNCEEPWEKAFHKAFEGTSMRLDQNVKEAFEEGFEAGINYALGDKK